MKSTNLEEGYASHEELAGDGVKALARLYESRNDTQRKIDNIVSVITQTGSPTLIKNLDTLEIDKQALTVQIENEEANLVANQLNEQEIIAAYRRAQELFESGSLPQRKQLLNLYLNRVNVYPEYVQIHLLKVPVNIIRPTSGKDELPAVNDSEADLHILLKTAKLKPLPHLKRGGTGENVVEARGIEFPSTDFLATYRFYFGYIFYI